MEVVISEKAGIAVVSTLDNVQRHTGQMYTGAAGHDAAKYNLIKSSLAPLIRVVSYGAKPRKYQTVNANIVGIHGTITAKPSDTGMATRRNERALPARSATGQKTHSHVRSNQSLPGMRLRPATNTPNQRARTVAA
ncbi:MAG: hypothetical protein LLG15_09610 [Betaproteobacteria bacterium]|nr:hypothetical protein [Betaproteobacteria bacterium]